MVDTRGSGQGGLQAPIGYIYDDNYHNKSASCCLRIGAVLLHCFDNFDRFPAVEQMQSKHLLSGSKRLNVPRTFTPPFHEHRPALPNNSVSY